jgi:phosphocarrier protein
MQSERISTTVEVKYSGGLHMRPSVRLVDLCSCFACEITLRNISYPHCVVDGKSIMGVSLLNGIAGSTLRVEAEGSDAEAAIEAVRDFFDGVNDEGLDYIRRSFEDKE